MRVIIMTFRSTSQIKENEESLRKQIFQTLFYYDRVQSACQLNSNLPNMFFNKNQFAVTRKKIIAACFRNKLSYLI